MSGQDEVVMSFIASERSYFASFTKEDVVVDDNFINRKRK